MHLRACGISHTDLHTVEDDLSLNAALQALKQGKIHRAGVLRIQGKQAVNAGNLSCHKENRKDGC